MPFETTQENIAAIRVTRCDTWSDFAEAIRHPTPTPAAASATISSRSIFRGCTRIAQGFECHPDGKDERFKPLNRKHPRGRLREKK